MTVPVDLDEVRRRAQARIDWDGGCALPQEVSPETIVALVDELKTLRGDKPKVVGGKMRVKAYDVLSRALDEGIECGWRRAHKHNDKPSDEAVKESVEREVMNSICEFFEFD